MAETCCAASLVRAFATAQAIGRRAQQFLWRIQRRIGADGRFDHRRNLLLEGRAQVFHKGGFDDRTLSPRELGPDGDRKHPKCGQVGRKAAYRLNGGGVIDLQSGQPVDPCIEQNDAGIDALRPTPLEGKLRSHLGTTVALATH